MRLASLAGVSLTVRRRGRMAATYHAPADRGSVVMVLLRMSPDETNSRSDRAEHGEQHDNHDRRIGRIRRYVRHRFSSECSKPDAATTKRPALLGAAPDDEATSRTGRRQ